MARITMPQLGETVTEGTVTRWLKSEGDEISVDEPLLEVSTDKVETEIPSAFAGTVRRIVVGEGDTVPIGSLLAIVGDDDDLPVDDSTAARPGAGRTAGAGASSRAFRQQMEGGQGYLHAPVHRSGRHRRASRDPSASRGSGRPVDELERAPSQTPRPEPQIAIDEREVAERIPFSAIRRRTAANLTASIRTAAHTLTVVEVDYSAVEAARIAHGPSWRERNGFGL
jgi:pyruvate dehydrogenase E2 component (dihydrolipoamide acetyltransferase)